MNTKQISRTARRLLLLSALVAVFGPAGRTLAAEPVRGRALLIGIQDYDKAPKLPGVTTDVEKLRKTLVERGGYKVETVVNSAIGDRSVERGHTAEREALAEALEGWLKDRRPEETVLLYFSGHGFRDDQNKLYLAAKDCDPNNPKPGGIPLSESEDDKGTKTPGLRTMLEECRARSKLLVLDACHAGSARTAIAKSLVNAKELGDFFEETKGLVTLASCTGEQKSLMWPEKGQSLFTYWLAQGLCGHADREPLGEITLNELDDYVARKVRRTAEKIHSVKQTPTRLQGPGATADVLLRLEPGSLKRLYHDLAEQMDVLIRLEGIERVGVVPEFTSGTSGNVLGREYGLLATHCPVELGNLLTDKSMGDYRVMSINAVREVLQANGIAPKDIGTSKCRGIQIKGKPLMGLVAGRIESLNKGTIALQCKLIETATGDVLGIAGGTAQLCGSESGMAGVSGRARPTGTADSDVPPQLEPAEIDAEAQHPLRDPSFPYRARIMVKGSGGKLHERQVSFKGNDCYVTLRQGEVFEIYQGNFSDKPVFTRVLVDGLNTLPDRPRGKGVYVEPAAPTTLEQAQPANLVEARAWGPLERGKEYAVRGFYVKTGDDAEYDAFKVVDADQSIATEAGYTDQLGLITVAFYDLAEKPPPPPRGAKPPGIGRGGRYHTQTPTYTGDKIPGRLLAVVHIRYGE